MNNYFFPEKKIKFLNFFFEKNQSFVFNKDIHNKENLKNQTLINEDLYNFQDHSEICIESFKIANKIRLSNYFSKNELLDKVLKKKLIINIEEILRITFLSEKIISYYKLKNLYVCKLFQDLDLLNYLKDNNYISKKINISKTYFYLSKLYSLSLNIYFFLNLFFLPEKIFFLCRKNSKKKKFFAAFNSDVVPNLHDNSMYTQLLNKIKKPSIFVKELKINESFFFKKKNKNLKNVLFISDVFKNISFLCYILKFYKRYFFERFQLVFSFNQNYIEKYRYFSNKMCWEVFFHCFEVEKFMTAMLPCDVTSQIIQKKHSKETIFFYFSSTYEILNSTNDSSNNYVSQIQYNHMSYSSLIANKISIDYLDKKSNNFDKLLQFKPVTLCLSSKSKRNILLFKKKFNLKNKKIIALFDNPFGYKGVLNSNEYLDYLKYLNFLINKYKNFNFIFNKKNKSYFFNSTSSNSKKMNFEIKKMKYFKNFINFKFQLTSPEVMHLSDIIMCHPHSSVMNESFTLGKTTVMFNYTKLTSDDHFYKKIVKKININDIKYKYRWLEKDILNLLKINSKKFVNIHKDKNISDLINYLND